MRIRWSRILAALLAMMVVWLIGVASSIHMTTVSASALGSISPSLGHRPPALQTPQAAAAPARKVIMAEEVFKNVQAMKGTPVDDFMATMGLMASALAFDCVSCHPNAGTDQVQWEFDSPVKRTARRMVTMVQTINKENFGGRQVVTCWTCHRGRDKPVMTPALDTWYGEPTFELDDIFVRTPGSPSPDAILDKYLTAVGGAQKLASVTSFVASGKSVGFGGFGGDGVFEIGAQAPDKRFTHISFPTAIDRGDSTRTYDGNVGWITNPLAVLPKYELTGGELSGARVDALLSFPGQIKQALTNLRVGPATTVGDRDVQTVQGNGPGNVVMTLYFAEDSGLLVRTIRYSPSPIGRLPTQVDYSDYRDVGGIKMPFKYTFAWLDGRDSFQVDKVALNVKIDASKFGEPPLMRR